MRARLVSLPSASRVPNSGGAVLRPHTATRMGWNIWPALMPSSSAASRRAASSASWVNSVPRQDVARAFRGRAAPWRHRLFAGSVRRYRKAASSSAKKKSPTVSTSRSRPMRSRISGVICAIFSGSHRNRRRARTAAGVRGEFVDRHARGSCSALSQTALGSNGSSSVKLTTALWRWMPSRENARSVPGASAVRGRPWATSPAGRGNSRRRAGRKPASR